MEGRQLRRRTKIYFGIMHGLYLIVALLAFVPHFWPLCTDEKSYPAVLNFAGMLFIANYIFHFVINCRKDKALRNLTEEKSDLNDLEKEEKAEKEENEEE